MFDYAVFDVQCTRYEFNHKTDGFDTVEIIIFNSCSSVVVLVYGCVMFVLWLCYVCVMLIILL